MITHACNPRTPETEVQGWPQVQGQTGLWSKTLSHKDDEELEKQARAQGERTETQSSLHCS